MVYMADSTEQSMHHSFIYVSECLLQAYCVPATLPDAKR